MWRNAANGKSLICNKYKKAIGGDAMCEWNWVRGYEGIYKVSDTGRVESVGRYIKRSDGVVCFRSGRPCACRNDKDGYCVVKLSKDGVSKLKTVHRLVYEAFCGDIPDGFEVDHIDFNRSNNCIDNLRILNHRENVKHTVDGGRNYTATHDISGGNNPNYGNRVLHERYSNNKLYSISKQSRPGSQNGRSRKIEMSYAGNTKKFDCIKDCACYLISIGATKASVDSITSNIITAIKTSKSYLNRTYSYIR